MQRVLFISNGHGEVAIARRIARAVRALAGPAAPALDHLALVGSGGSGAELSPVGPRRPMPSGGLVAMGNVRAFAGDVAAGFARLFAQQVGFVLAHGSRYDAAVAVGDVYALGFALLARAATPPLYVGTAKSVFVAPYGPFERVLLRRAARVFVRDRPTAERLQAEGVAAEAPGNVIVDLAHDAGAAASGAASESRGDVALAILPGSRERAYLDGLRLARVVRALGERLQRPVAGRFSIAPGLSAERFAAILETDGWQLAAAAGGGGFAARSGHAELTAGCGTVGELLRASTLVLGQAGTANEEAAALGVPVVALAAPEAEGRRGDGWYRMRQRRLLGDALTLVSPEPAAAAAEIAALLASDERLERMGAAGRERMGPPGGAEVIGRALLAALDERLR